MEGFSGNSTEQRETPKSYKFDVEYRYTDNYGQYYGDALHARSPELEVAPAGATAFDGYVETDFGSYGIHEPIKVVPAILNKITELCGIEVELVKAQKEIKEFRSMEHSAENRFENGGDSGPLVLIRTQLDSLQSSESRLKIKKSYCDEYLAKYKL